MPNFYQITKHIHMEKLPIVRGEYRYNEKLSKYTRFKVGGIADVLFFPKDEDDLIFFLKNKQKNIPITVLGAGSNVLIRDNGVKGVVINLRNLNNVYLDSNYIYSGCGAITNKVYNFAKNNNIAGFEFLGTIPGTVGGACKMNAGCYGSCIADILVSIKTTDFDGNIKTYSLTDCQMEYRKNNLPNNLIFLEAIFSIKNIKDKAEIEAIYNEMMAKRNSSQPINENTCGSTFKNPAEMPAWKLIQELGFQGIDYNGVKMSEKHANFLINYNNDSSNNIETLICKIKEKALLEKNINLELEIQII